MKANRIWFQTNFMPKGCFERQNGSQRILYEPYKGERPKASELIEYQLTRHQWGTIEVIKDNVIFRANYDQKELNPEVMSDYWEKPLGTIDDVKDSIVRKLVKIEGNDDNYADLEIYVE